MMTATSTSIDRARQYIARIPGAVSGQGGHDQTFSVACALVNGFALSEQDAFVLLSEYNQRCAPPWSARELHHKVQNAVAAQHSKRRGHLLGTEAPMRSHERASRPAPRPKIDPTTAVEVWLGGFSCNEVDLWEASPIRPPEDWRQDALVLVSNLYRPGELINFVTRFATSKDGKARPDGAGETIERNALLTHWNRKGMPVSPAGGWLRMNPVDGRGITDSNVTAFRFALLECDGIPLELQLPLLAKLPLPVAAIITSGGRSVHAWVQVDAENADEYQAAVSRMLALLAHLGIDCKNKNPSRLSRLPGVTRSLGAEGDGRQRLLFLNSDPKQGAIL